MSDQFVWSPEQMIARLGGDEGLARQLVPLFLAECPRMMAQVRESVEGGSADAVRRAAHAFKGSVSNFAIGGPAATAFELENLGREGRVAEAAAVLARLEREVASFLDQLRTFNGGH
jgi:HPt (histidine-containing phosphotransfer) domain-containing protein